MIQLEKLLAGLDVGVEPFDVCSVRGGARLTFAPPKEVTVRYILAGTGVARMIGGPAVPIPRHTFIVVPPGVRQSIGPAHGDAREVLPAMACGPVGDGMKRLATKVGEGGVVIASGAIRATYRRTTGLFDHLREPMVENFGDDDPICHTFDALLWELAAPQPGSGALTAAMMKQCLVLFLRRRCASGAYWASWLPALDQPRLGAALAAMLGAPETPFTVERLAEIAGMSRSAFAAHFAEAFDRSPMDFLREVRLRRAGTLLRETDLPVKAVAKLVGYASRSYFSRAFKALYGVDPARFRAAPESASGEVASSGRSTGTPRSATVPGGRARRAPDRARGRAPGLVARVSRKYRAPSRRARHPRRVAARAARRGRGAGRRTRRGGRRTCCLVDRPGARDRRRLPGSAKSAR